MAVDWSGVRQRVTALAEAPGSNAVLGARWHGFNLEPPLSGTELAEVEAQLGTWIPVEYRSFLSQVSRGGAGPAFGLFVLRRDGQGWWRWDGDGAEHAYLNNPNHAFPHLNAWAPGDELGAPPARRNYPTDEDYARAEERYERRYDQVLYSPENIRGAFPISHRGGALRDLLVFTGNLRGTIWADNRARGAGLAPRLSEDGARVGFARWYLSWLDQAETAGHRS